MSLRARLATAAPSVADEQFLVIRSGGGNFALPSEIVRGILPFEDAPGTETVPFQGQDLPLRNLAGRFGWSSRPPASETKVLMCGTQETLRAFIVDEVCGLTDVPGSAIRSLPPHFAGPERGWFSGLFLFRDAVALVVQPAWLLGHVTAAPALVHSEPRPSDPAAPAPGRGTSVAPSREAPAVPKRETSGAPSRQTETPVSKVTSAGGDSPEIVELEEASDAEDTPWADL